MMGMYNLVFGTSPTFPIARLLLAPREFGRLRDGWFEKLLDGTIRIAIYTRNGGNNRYEYMPDFSNDPLYISDADDKFDHTYATIYFKLPEDALEICKKYGAPDDFSFDEISTDPIDMSEVWQKALEKLSKE